RRRLRAANVVRMEVRDRDARGVRLRPGRVSETEAGVEERPVREIAMDVLGAGRKRQRQTPNTVLELYERLFYTACRGHADRVSRRALQERPEPGQADGLQAGAAPRDRLLAPVYGSVRSQHRAPVMTD